MHGHVRSVSDRKLLASKRKLQDRIFIMVKLLFGNSLIFQRVIAVYSYSVE